MSSYSDGCNAFPNPIGVSWPVFDFENKKLLFDVANLDPDRENMDFASGNGLANSNSCEATAGQDINLSNSGEDALLYMYEPTMEFLGLKEIINPTLISNEQKTDAAIYGPSLSVDYGERAVYPVSKSIGSSEKIGYNANHLLYGIPGDASRTMQNTKTDPYVTDSVLETSVQVIPKKWKKDRHKAFSSNDREEKSSTDIDVTRQVTPGLLPNIVSMEPSAKSGNDCIYVRAGRGQATDSHSLAERVRRKKISDRMNILRNLVPGCDQVPNKTLLLEEIINYVQSLQNQIEILSMKLQYISSLPTFDQELTGHPFKEVA